MVDTYSVRLTIEMRRHPELMAAVRTLVASAPLSPAAGGAWLAIRQHPAVSEAVTRGMVYESALELGMTFHASRSAAMEVA